MISMYTEKIVFTLQCLWQVGDHIERINSESLVGKRHFEVAKMLKEIPRDTVFTIRLVEPLKAGFSNIDSRGNSRRGKKPGYGSGKETLRLKADGKAHVQQVSTAMQQGIDSINQLLEGFMGINDSELEKACPSSQVTCRRVSTIAHHGGCSKRFLKEAAPIHHPVILNILSLMKLLRCLRGSS
ncbi:PDZ domain-containing protein gipc3 [Homalodisca vitripennis]|nr:PDZ domain-containing protein gipc3 [Homalodisca vitripennis]